jgi:5-methyltetrahydrofolate--homocysteine methyltransferase
MLQLAGLTDGGAPELWNVEHPDKVQAVYRGYFAAGSALVETNTFGGNVARLKFHQIGDRVREVNVAGARLARVAADEVGGLVAGSVGPTGELIEPVGPLRMADAEAYFAEQIAALAEGGVDLLVIETMSHLNEVHAAVRAAQRVAPEIPLAATLSFDTSYHTMMGVSPKEAVRTISEWGVRIIGANCGTGPVEMAVVMTEMAQYRPPGVFLYAQSNAGLPYYDAGKIAYDGTPEVMAQYALTMRNLGVDIIGACCGSTPAHIEAMRLALEAVQDEPVAGPPSLDSEAAIESVESRVARGAERRRARRGGEAA